MKYSQLNLVQLILLMIGIMSMTSCSLFSPVQADASKSYLLNTVPAEVMTRPTHQATLLVLQPDVLPIYNTTQMAYSIKPHAVAYFAENQWAETPAQMLLPLLVQTLQKTHGYHAITMAPYTGHYDYVLSTQFLQLLQDFTHPYPRVSLRVRMQLNNASTGRVIATKDINIDELMMQKNPYAGVLAANRAAVRMLKEVARFCLKHA